MPHFLICTHYDVAGPSLGMVAANILCEINANTDIEDKETEFLARLKRLYPEMWVSIPAEYSNRINLHIDKGYFFQYAVLTKKQHIVNRCDPST